MYFGHILSIFCHRTNTRYEGLCACACCRTYRSKRIYIPTYRFRYMYSIASVTDWRTPKGYCCRTVVVGGNVSQDTQIDKISHPNTCTKYILKNSLRRWAAYPYPSTPFHTVHILGIHQSPASSFISQQCELKAKALEIEREVRILQRIS